MKKLVLGAAVATGLAVAMAGQSLAAELTSCDMNQAILEAKVVIAEIGGEASTLKDAKGVPISNHVKYLEKLVATAENLVDGEDLKAPEELYAAVTEGTQALRLITGIAQETAKQTAAPKTTKTTAQLNQPAQAETKAQMTKSVARYVATETSKVEVPKKETPKVEFAVAKVDTLALAKAKLTSVSVRAEVAGPEETVGLDQEMEVPTTGEVDTGELEKVLMTIGVASAVGMLGLAGICMVIGRR